MKQIVLLCALCALFGCKQATVPETEPIALYYATAEQSKTDILTQGDQIGIFAAVEGTENYFLENAQYVVGSDGRSLSTSPAVYYPEAKQAVAFTAYLPFGGVWNGAVGTFSVPADQSTTLKQADLCWAKASSTPMATPVPLEFAHKMARLLITTNTPTTKIAIPNAFSGGTLDIKTGTFTNTLKSSLSTSGTELILPAQTITRLVLTVAGVEYIYDGSISLETAKTTSTNLTLNPTTKTTTLSGSSTTNWISSATQGNPTQAVSNILTMHWANYLPQGATPDKVTLTINNTDYTVSSGITYADKTFTVPFASLALRYPYTITKIAFNNIPLACTQLLGATIYKSTASTLGIKDVPNAVLVNGIWWATGNLIADGPNGCKIGAPMDYGLYFVFGSLIGWSGGANGDGTGQGSPSLSLQVKPSSYTGSSAWGGAQPYRGNAGTGYSLPATDNTSTGVGDPCRVYLGRAFRLPTITEWYTILSSVPTPTSYASTPGWSYNDTYKRAEGPSGFIVPFMGYRYYIGGNLSSIGVVAQFSCASWRGTNTTQYCPEWTSSHVYPMYDHFDTHAFPVRCVATL